MNSANAATRTWTGTSSNLWDVDANWGGTKPVAGDDLIFPASASNKSTSNDIAADTSFNSITFEGTGYTLAGNRISLPAGGITSNISGGSNTMSLNLLLTATTTIAVTNSNETLTISGIISDGGSAFGVNKTGAGQLTLSGNNSFTGDLVIKAGTVKGQTSLNAFGVGTIFIGDTSGTADARLQPFVTGTFTNPISVVSGSSGELSIYTDNSTPTLSGGITLNNNLSIIKTNVDGLNITGGITGTGNITISNGTGSTITLSTTAVNNTGTITNSGSGAGGVTISAVIGTNVTEVIQNSSTSQLSLSGNNTFTGNGLTILKGTVRGSSNANAFGSGNITLGNSAGGSDDATIFAASALTFANPIVLASNTTGTLTIAGQVSGCDATFSGGVTGTNNLNLNSTYTNGCGLRLTTGSVNNTGTITNSSTGSNTRIAITSVIGSNVTEVIQNSSTATMTLSGDNAFTGGLTIKSGTVGGSSSANAFGGGGTGTITLGNSAGGTDNATLHGNTNTTYANPIVLASNTTGTLTISSSGFTGSTFTGGITGTNNLTINQSATNNPLTFSSTSVNNTGTITNTSTGNAPVAISAVIGSNVTGLIQNSATSQMTLSGNNSTISGDVTITAGTLELSGTTNLNVTGNWSNSGTFTANSSTVTLNGTNQSISGSTTFFNLSKTDPNNNGTNLTLTFTAGQTQTIGGLLTFNGIDDDDRVRLVSSSSGSSWNLTANGTFDVDWVYVKDSDASGGQTIVHTNTIGGSGNINWNLDEPFVDTYNIYSDSINAGGRRSTSTNYILEDTVGEIATGVSDSASYSLKAGYQQMNEVFISITAAADVALSPDIGGISGGQSDGQTAVTVITDGSAGYELTIEALTSPALQTPSSSGSSDSSGPSFTGTVVNDASIGSIAWLNPGNVEGDTADYASISGGLISSAPTNYLKATNFGFDIPSDATIDGIEVEWEKSKFFFGAGSIFDNAVRIVKGGAIGSEDKSSGTDWSSSFSYASYGGASDLWGETWTPADINSSDFGVTLSAVCPTSCSMFNPGDSRVSRVRVTVYYQTAGVQGYTFDDYVTAVSEVPDFNFTVKTTSAELGYSSEGNDTVQLFRDNGSACNIYSGSVTADKCWIGLSTTPRVVSRNTAGNWPSGTETTIKFKAFSGSSHIQQPGVYTATTTLTAVAL